MLKGFMALLVVRRRGQRERSKTRGMIFFPGDWRMKVSRKLR